MMTEHDASTAKRNAVVVEYLPSCIDRVIWHNYSLLQAAHMERDDVYQQLALRLIRAVETYHPNKGKLKNHIYAQLHYELLNCKRPYRLHGITGLPSDFRSFGIISLNDFGENHEKARKAAKCS